MNPEVGPEVSVAWQRVCRLDDVENGHPTASVLAVPGAQDGGAPVCVVLRPDGGAVVMLDRCPHRDFPLSRGTVRDGVLVCSGHFWRFDLVTGERTDLPEQRATLYPTRVVDGWVEAQVPPPPPRRSVREWLLAEARAHGPRTDLGGSGR